MAKAKVISSVGERYSDWVNEFSTNGWNAAAASRTVFPDKTQEQAKNHSVMMLKNPEVVKLLDARRKQLEKKSIVNQEWIVKTLVENVQRGMALRPVIDKNGVFTGKLFYNGAVVNKSLELLGKHLGMFKEDNAGQGKTVNQSVIFMSPGEKFTDVKKKVKELTSGAGIANIFPEDTEPEEPKEMSERSYEIVTDDECEFVSIGSDSHNPFDIDDEDAEGYPND